MYIYLYVYVLPRIDRDKKWQVRKRSSRNKSRIYEVTLLLPLINFTMLTCYTLSLSLCYSLFVSFYTLSSYTQSYIIRCIRSKEKEGEMQKGRGEKNEHKSDWDALCSAQCGFMSRFLSYHQAERGREGRKKGRRKGGHKFDACQTNYKPPFRRLVPQN